MGVFSCRHCGPCLVAKRSAESWDERLRVDRFVPFENSLVWYLEEGIGGGGHCGFSRRGLN